MYDITAKQRLARAVGKIMARDEYMALGALLMVGKREVREQIPGPTQTACTNGRDEFYTEAFVDSLTDKELRFLILHEVRHKMYRHLLVWQHLAKADTERANQAMDYVINDEILEEGDPTFITMPAGGLHDPQYRGMTVQQVFNALPPSGGSNQSQSSGDGEPMDGHDWDNAKDMTAKDQEELTNAIDEALRQGKIMADKSGKPGARGVDALLKPKVDWRKALREFVAQTCTGKDYSTWKRPNRRFMGSGYYMPSGVSHRLGELVVAVDTSGSIGTAELSQLLSEVVEITRTTKPERIRLLYWDTEVAGDETYEPNTFSTLAQTTKPAGGGGTDAACVPKYIKEHGIKAQACVVLTDGYVASWGEWAVPVLWCISERNDITAPCGKTVHMEGN